MKLQCVVVTPEKAVVDQEVDSLVIPLFDGEMGILPRRAPLVSKLGNGSLRLKIGSTEMVYFIEGGTVQLAKNVVTLLTPRATEVTSLDVTSAKKVLEAGKAEGQTSSERTALKDKARALIRTKERFSKR